MACISMRYLYTILTSNGRSRERALVERGGNGWFPVIPLLQKTLKPEGLQVFFPQNNFSTLKGSKSWRKRLKRECTNNVS